jgi:ABC-type transport system substrate-binding protein
MQHPVGTGPFRLAQWRRSSRLVLERNADYRPDFYDEQPAAGDRVAQEIAARLRGRRLPMVDRVEIYIVEESQPLWLAFLNGEHDLIGSVPQDPRLVQAGSCCLCRQWCCSPSSAAAWPMPS